MSKTYCRFCDITAEGIYLHCPRCGGWLPPKDALPAGEPAIINPEPFDLAEFGKSWDSKIRLAYMKYNAGKEGAEVNQETKKEYDRRKSVLPKRYPLPIRIALTILEAVLYLIVIAVALAILGLLAVAIAALFTQVAL